MPAHTHDGIDWVARLADLRQADSANAPALRAVADRLIESLPAPRPTVMDVGCGAGGMSAALAAALAGRAARAAGPTTGTLEAAANTRADTHTWTENQPTSDTAASAGDQAAGDQRPGSLSPGGVVVGGRLGEPGGNRADDQRTGGVPSGGTLVLVDMVPELLAAAEEIVAAAAGVGGAVRVSTRLADIADPDQFERLPEVDLVWASNVTHHVPDQRAAVATLVRRLARGGCLALSEGGLSMRCLPWDVGVGEPGLQDRLIAAHGTWFHRMRTEMPGTVRLPIGWNQALGEAGLTGVTAFSYLVDVPAPLSDAGRAAVVSWLTWMTHATADLLDPADVAALHRLLDPADPAHVARRDDVFMLKASTVYLGWR
jgi:SAM-dependent methyltransferase